jgi:hypothetical protein
MFPQDLLIAYVLGALLTSGALTLWFFSNLPIHLLKTLRVISEEDEVYTWDDLQIVLSTKSSFWGELLSCPLCLGFWTSLGIAIILQQICVLSPWFIPSCIFSWPVFLYFFYSKFSTEGG